MGVWVFDDEQRLRETLTIDCQPNTVFAGQRHRTDLGFTNAPMQNLARVAATEAALFPDVGIFRWRGAKQSELWGIVEEIPFHAVHAGAAGGVIKLANDGAA